jgi:L-alanine-DL-glutamate epimerase-like enolase superfamily enzyme
MLLAAIEKLRLARPFSIARGTRTEQAVVTCKVIWNGQTGRGECTPYARYDETPETVTTNIESMSEWLAEALFDGPAPARRRSALTIRYHRLEAFEMWKSAANVA